MNRILLAAASFFGAKDASSDEVVSYGLDVSFAHTTPDITTNFPWLPHNEDPDNNPMPDEHVDKPVQVLGDRKKVYDDYIQGCRDYWNKEYGSEQGAMACDGFEKDRFVQSLTQPRSMVNFTDVGYKKIRAPEHVFKMIADFWKANKDKESDEVWKNGNSFVNYWENPSKMVSVENATLVGGGRELHDAIWHVTNDLISEWTGQKLSGSSVYGIRIYKEGAILAPHVDRLPLISSAIINVEQDVDEEWPLEVLGHDGVVRNVTMQPGDMVLYESHSVIHGRPFALKGRYFANIFIHFMPVPSEEQINEAALPPYILEGSIEADRWLRGEFANKIPGAPGSNKEPNSEPTLLQEESHTAAAKGDMEALARLATENKDKLHAKDGNGWQPIHEAIRAGHRDVIEFLVEHGADVNEKTGYHGVGEFPLDLAKNFHGEENDLVGLLQSMGAKGILSENTVRSDL